MIKINSYLLLGAFSLLLFMPGITSLPVIDRDEPHFAQATRQMVQTGNYFQIRFQETTRFQKPPGINWLQAASVKVFSDGDSSSIWPYRLPSLLGGLLSVLLTFFFARRFVHERVALLASAFLAASVLLVVEAHLAVTDASLLMSVVLMEGALWVIYQAGMEKVKAYWGWSVLFWFAMAYGFVLKGVTPLVGALSIGTLCLVERRVDWLRGLHLYRGFLLFFLLSLAWLVPVNLAEHSNYLMQMIHKDLLPKLQGGHESHGKPPFFHLLSLPLTFWPASLFLWQGAVYAFNQRHLHVIRFLLAWIVPTWIFFEVMPTKLPQYVLPTFPAIAVLCAMGVADGVMMGKNKSKMALWVLQLLWGVLSVVLAFGLAYLPYFLMGEVTPISLMIFFSLSIMSSVCVYYAGQGLYRRASLMVLLTAAVSFPLIFAYLLPQLRPLWFSRDVAAVIPKPHISARKPLLVVGGFEPSLVFYLNTHQVLFVDVAKARYLLQKDPNRLLLVNKSDMKTIQSALGVLPILATITGYNYNRGQSVAFELLEGG